MKMNGGTTQENWNGIKEPIVGFLYTLSNR